MPERFRHGLVIGKFYPPHAGHSFLIRQALRQCERLTVQVLGASVESIPYETRAAWLREEHPTAHVVGALDDEPIDMHSDAAWTAHVDLSRSLLDEPVDAVFTSDAYGAELARRLGAQWVQIDPERRMNPISGTAVRADLAAHWHELGPAVREGLAVRVVVLGAESTGSTTLAAALADELGTDWVPEYGREYSIIREGGPDAPWRSAEFDHIVDRQIPMERAAARTSPHPIVVCDTDVLATALWHERYLERPAPRILERAAAHPPALYVLTGDEIPFVQDGTRDGEHLRHDMQQRFREALVAQAVPWLEVRGTVAERLAQAVPEIRRVAASALAFAAPLDARPIEEQRVLQKLAQRPGRAAARG